MSECAVADVTAPKVRGVPFRAGVDPRRGEGRPKGARNRLGEDFIRALADDFEEHGPAAIQEVRENRPQDYLKVVASILPKELKITHTTDFESLTDEQLRARLTAFLADFAALGVVIDGYATERAEAGRGQGEAPPLPALPETDRVS